MATAKEVKEHLEIALKEIGAITPWYDNDVDEWIFKHRKYPVEYGGATPEEVLTNYPKYLREFIKQRLNDNLNPITKKKTKGHGGLRQGAGRPKGSVKDEKMRINLPKDIVFWFKHDSKALECVRKTMRKCHFKLPS